MPRIGQQRLFQHLQALPVQVRRGFVGQQGGAGPLQGLGDAAAGALPAGATAPMVVEGARGNGGQGRPPRRVHLGNIAHRPIPLHLARRFQFPGQYPQQGGLSRTIGPHQAHPLPLGQGERLKIQHQPSAQAQADIPGTQDHFRH